MENHSGTLNILFSDEDVLLVFEWDCLNSSVYNMTENMKKMAEKIALSEGFFAGKEQINFWFVELQPVKNWITAAATFDDYSSLLLWEE